MKRLNKGDTIAIITPGDLLPERYSMQNQYILEYIVNEGYKCINLTNTEDNFTPEEKAKNLQKAFQEKNVSAIFPICGGISSYDIINLLDYNMISKNPKIICGYSYLSVLLNTIALRSNIPVFYGPHMNFINDRSTRRERMYTVCNFWNMLTLDKKKSNAMSKHEKIHTFRYNNEEKLLIKNIFSTNNIETAKKDNFFYYNKNCKSDRIYGKLFVCTIGCLSDFFAFNPVINEKYILMLDMFLPNNENPGDLIREVKKYINTENCVGIALTPVTTHGDFADSHYYTRNEIISIVDDIYEIFNKEIDVLYGFPIGHCTYKITIPINLFTTIFTKEGNIEIDLPFEK